MKGVLRLGDTPPPRSPLAWTERLDCLPNPLQGIDHWVPHGDPLEQESEMAASEKAAVHPEFALKVMGALPADLRTSAELKQGGCDYTILEVSGKSVASIRDRGQGGSRRERDGGQMSRVGAAPTVRVRQ